MLGVRNPGKYQHTLTGENVIGGKRNCTPECGDANILQVLRKVQLPGLAEFAGNWKSRGELIHTQCSRSLHWTCESGFSFLIVR